MAIRVTVWNEYLHEVQFPEVAEVYPKGIHGCIADFLKEAGMDVKTATLREPEHGLTQEVVDNTDVLIWWGHMAHQEVSDETSAQNGSWIFGAHRSTVYLAVGVQFCLGCVAL